MQSPQQATAPLSLHGNFPASNNIPSTGSGGWPSRNKSPIGIPQTPINTIATTGAKVLPTESPQCYMASQPRKVILSRTKQECPNARCKTVERTPRGLRLFPAHPDHAQRLTEIAFAAKRHWGYPEAWIESWRDGLTITPQWIAAHETTVAAMGSRLVGFSALDGGRKKLELAHLWVAPDAMGCGVGRALFQHALEQAGALGFRQLEIESDPNAEDFYARMGARRIGSVIRETNLGRRALPVMICETTQTTSDYPRVH